jgi:hypothetical protein
MLFIQSAFLEIVAFDLVIGLLVFRYFRFVQHERRRRLVPISVGIIAPLVNASVFLNPMSVEIAVVLGGAGLLILLSGGQSETMNRKEPNSPEPTQDAVH